MTLTIDRGLDQPVYEQIASQLRRLIATESLAAGTNLPAVRRLAGDLGVSLNTIARAYRRLEAEGFLQIRDRTGVTVSAPAARLEQSTRTALLDQMRATLARLRQAGMPADELMRVTALELRSMTTGRRELEDD